MCVRWRRARSCTRARSACSPDERSDIRGAGLASVPRMSLRSSGLRLRPARRAGRRVGALETWPGGVPLVVAGEMGCGGKSLRAFGKLLDAMQDRQQVDVGKGEPVLDEITGVGDRLV